MATPFKMTNPLKKTYRTIDEDGNRKKVKTDKWGRIKKVVIKGGGGRKSSRRGQTYNP